MNYTYACMYVCMYVYFEVSLQGCKKVTTKLEFQ